MKLVSASFEILEPDDLGSWNTMLVRIERAARTCYKSEERISVFSAEPLVKKLIGSGHHAMLEHGGDISVRFVVDRGVSHELVRHRLASFAQESTRYCNYSRGKFGGECTFIDARPHLSESEWAEWESALATAESYYLSMLEAGVKPQMARSVLPNATKTEVVVTANPREWRHIFELRTSERAHPQMREVMCPLLAEFRRRVTVLFDDVGVVG